MNTTQQQLHMALQRIAELEGELALARSETAGTSDPTDDQIDMAADAYEQAKQEYPGPGKAPLGYLLRHAFAALKNAAPPASDTLTGHSSGSMAPAAAAPSAPSAEERTHPAVEQVYENWHVYLRGVDRPDFRKQLYRLADAIVAGTAEALSARSSAPATGWPPIDIAAAELTFEELWKLGQRLLSAAPNLAGHDLVDWLKSWWSLDEMWRDSQRKLYGPDVAHLMRGVADMIERCPPPAERFATDRCEKCPGPNKAGCIYPRCGDDAQKVCEELLLKYASDLFDISRAAAFKFPIPNTNPPRYLVCGEADQIKGLLDG